jgi:hypothetical protein
MRKERNLLVGVGGATVSRAPSNMPTTASGTEFQKIPLKFTLMGLPDDIPRISDFRRAAKGYIKEILSYISDDIDGLKFKEVNERYVDTLLNCRRSLSTSRYVFSFANNTFFNFTEEEDSQEHTRIYNLYYDAVAIVPNPNEFYGPLIVETAQYRHAELLQQIQEYDPTQYYYADDFDICTATTEDASDRSFDLCSQDHQLVPIKFGVLALPDDMDRDAFKAEAVGILQDVLKGIDGLQMTGFYENRVDVAGKSEDFYFDVDLIKRNRDMELVISNELNGERKVEILNRIQSYTNEEGRGIEWCITDAGRFSAEPCTTTKTTNNGMPTWAIVTIALSSALIGLGLIIWVCIILYQRSQDEDDFNNTTRKWVADPEDFYRNQNRLDRHRRYRHNPRFDGHLDEYQHQRIYARPPRNYGRARRHRHRHRRGRRPRHHRPRRGHRHYYDSEDSELHDTVETLPDIDNEYQHQMVLYQDQGPPQYPQIEQQQLLRLLPPPQQQQHVLQIEDQYNAAHHMRSQRELLQIEAQHPMNPPRPLSRQQEMLQIEAMRKSQQNLMPPQQGVPIQRPQPLPRQQQQQKAEDLEQALTVYCDEDFVNRPDPPTFNDRRRR